MLFEELESCQTDLRWQVAHIESPYLPDFVRLSIGMQVGASYNILSDAFIFLCCQSSFLFLDEYGLFLLMVELGKSSLSTGCSAIWTSSEWEHCCPG